MIPRIINERIYIGDHMGEKGYKIGEFVCSSKEEHDAIKSDLIKIKKIKEKLDEDNFEDLEKILEYFSQNKDALISVVGQSYKQNLMEKYKDLENEKIKFNDRSMGEQNISKEEGALFSDSHEDVRYLDLSIDIKMPKEKNKLYLFGGILITSLSSFFILAVCRLEKIDIMNGGENTLDSYYAALGLIWLAMMFIITIGIGIFEYDRIKEVYKAVKDAEDRALNLDRKNQGDADARGCLKIILLGLVILIPPLLIIIFIVIAILIALPKLQWLKENIKAVLAYLVYFFGQYMMLLGMLFAFELLSINGYLMFNAVIISLSVGAICGGFIYLISRHSKKPIYYAVRAMCTVPIMIIATILPFVGVAAYIYMLYGNHSKNSNKGYPGVHYVAGHKRVLADGRTIWIRPYPRTNPDGILWNNFSYKA